MNSPCTLTFRSEDYDLFYAIMLGTKQVEVRAWLPEYAAVAKCDRIRFITTKDGVTQVIERKLLNVLNIKSVDELLNRYDLRMLDPNAVSKDEFVERVTSFPGYVERIEAGGLLVFEFE